MVHCSAWQDTWTTTMDALEGRDIATINTILRRTEGQRKGGTPTYNEISGIDRVFAGQQPVSEPVHMGKCCNIDTGTGVLYLDQLTLARTDVEHPEFEAFEVIEL